MPLFVLDPKLAGISANRVRFMHQALADLRETLRGKGGDLVIRTGDPVAETIKLARESGADGIALAADVSNYARKRERRRRADADRGRGDRGPPAVPDLARARRLRRRTARRHAGGCHVAAQPVPPLRMPLAVDLPNAVHDRAGPGPAAFVANNSGNWQWTAGTGNDTKPYRRFNPIRQAERFDPDGVYVRRYVPELKSIEGKAVHQPWRLDLDLDYPRPLESRRDEAVWLRDQ